MLKLPNPGQAVIPKGKLEGYSLNPNHSEGRHKAVVFRAALGIGLAEAEELRAALREALQRTEALETKHNAQGQKYQLDFKMERMSKSAIIRSAWIIRNGEDFPRLITCYVL
ncbi:MAG: DUF6883 domain-containing protein [Cyanobacteria bacterium P01_A01_bin.116]